MKTSPANFTITYGHHFKGMTLGQIVAAHRSAEFEAYLGWMRVNAVRDGTSLSEQWNLTLAAWDAFRAVDFKIVPSFEHEQSAQNVLEKAAGEG